MYLLVNRRTSNTIWTGMTLFMFSGPNRNLSMFATFGVSFETVLAAARTEWGVYWWY